MNLRRTLKNFKSLEGKLGFKFSRILNFTDEPRFFQFYCSQSNPDSIDEEEQLGSAALSSNEDFAKVKSLGEYIERYCLENPPKKLKKASYLEISEKAVDPVKFVNFRDEDMVFRRKEYIEKLRTHRLSWVTGEDLATNKKVFIPAQLVFLKSGIGEPLIRPRISTGAAAHEDYNKAVLNGILECIERDSYMLRYLSKDSVPRVELDGKLKELEEYFDRYGLELKLFDITTDLNIPSFMCMNIDRTGVGPAVSVGLKSGLVPREAARGAIIESQQVRQWIRYSYVQDAMPEISRRSEIDSIKKRGYFWYGLDKISKLDFLFDGTITKIKEARSLVNSFNKLIRHLSDKGLDVYAVDITTKEIMEAGFYVVKAVIPQLHPLYLEENCPCLYSDRLNRNLNGRDLNLFPHPFM